MACYLPENTRERHDLLAAGSPIEDTDDPTPNWTTARDRRLCTNYRDRAP